MGIAARGGRAPIDARPSLSGRLARRSESPLRPRRTRGTVFWFRPPLRGETGLYRSIFIMADAGSFMMFLPGGGLGSSIDRFTGGEPPAGRQLLRPSLVRTPKGAAPPTPGHSAALAIVVPGI